MSGAHIVEAARGWLGTPWHHQARVRGVGVDCVGLVAEVGREVGLEVADVTGYRRMPTGRELRQALTKHLIEIDPEHARAGDVLLFNYAQAGGEAHVAIVTAPGQMIHAYEPDGAVIEHSIGAKWGRRIAGAFRVESCGG